MTTLERKRFNDSICDQEKSQEENFLVVGYLEGKRNPLQYLSSYLEATTLAEWIEDDYDYTVVEDVGDGDKLVAIYRSSDTKDQQNKLFTQINEGDL